MEAVEVITILYIIVPIISFTGYLPQIIKLFKLQKAPQSFSIATWAIWTFSYFISTAYALWVVGDFMFTVVCLLNLVCHGIILGLAVLKCRIPEKETSV